MNGYKIEEVAKLCGLTKRTIRYYEELGLLFPPERSEGGFRLYSDKHVERLQQIINARDVLGVSLQELQEFIALTEEFLNRREAYAKLQDKEEKLRNILEVEKTVEKRLQMIDQKIEKLTEIRKEAQQFYNKILQAKERYNRE